jgi:DNA processing protein
MEINSHKHDDAGYPDALRQLPQPPEQVYYAGEPLEAWVDEPKIAIVGSRKVTAYGRTVTNQLAAELARAGVTIISGLALGVDSIALSAALEAGGRTVAVLPGSVESIYPRSHKHLADQILATGGTLLSEYTGAGTPHKHQFIARNRLVAALSDAVLITEAALKSGTMHTVRFALEQGKTIFAVPGNITSAMSEGCNNLIKSGAIPVTGVNDILDAMEWQVLRNADTAPRAASSVPEEQLLLSLMQQGISDGAELLKRSGLSAAEYNQHLTMLEITGLIKPLGNDQWQLS